MIFKKTSGERKKKEDENCFKSRLKCDKRLRRLKTEKYFAWIRKPQIFIEQPAFIHKTSSIIIVDSQ